MRIEPEIGGIALGLLGNFNPAIFSPLWFARQGIVSDAEANEARLGVIHPEVVMFSLGAKNVHVESTRFQIESSEAPWITALDFVAKTFGEFLLHTPVTEFGIIRHVHFKMRSQKARHHLGRQLAPVAPWGDWGRELHAKEGVAQSGMVDLAMRDIWDESELSGYTQATIQPSNVLTGNAGVYMRINSHNILKNYKEGEGAERAIHLLAEKFERSIWQAEAIIDQIMTLDSEIA